MPRSCESALSAAVCRVEIEWNPCRSCHFASSFLNGFNAEGVGMKLTCDVNAANAKRMRFSSNTGVRHFTPSVAPGATFLRMAYISRRFLCEALGAASMYTGNGCWLRL